MPLLSAPDNLPHAFPYLIGEFSKILPLVLAKLSFSRTSIPCFSSSTSLYKVLFMSLALSIKDPCAFILFFSSSFFYFVLYLFILVALFFNSNYSTVFIDEILTYGDDFTE